jgi:nicotinamide-nucleotide amidase
VTEFFPEALLSLARRTVDALRSDGKRITTAESCTGGLITGLLTEVSGSSDVLGRGFVTYSNEAKTAVLGVPAEILRRHGAVSDETVRAMAEGALAASGDDADFAIAVSGIAGPGGGTAEKPVGTVHIGLAARGRPTQAGRHHFPGDRTQVRLGTVEKALELLDTYRRASSGDRPG